MFYKVLFIVGCIYFAIAWYGKNYGFGAQCEGAGYTGAAFERCVDRRVNGGPVYEENAH